MALALAPPVLGADFGEALVYDAVDLSEAAQQQADSKEEAESMESLLHWAIGEGVEVPTVSCMESGQACTAWWP